MSQRVLIRGVEMVLAGDGIDAASGSVREGNVLVDDGVFVDLDADAQTTCDEVIDGSGLHMLPGVIDDQVHFREPGLTHKEDLSTASHACAAGGVTTFLEMPNTKPPAITIEGVREKEKLGAEKSLVNYGFYIGATPDNAAELSKATEVPGIKIFIGSSTGNLLVDEQEALERIFAETTLPICAHCEDETTVRGNAERLAGRTDIAVHSEIRDENAAMIATKRATDLAKRHQHRFHVLHVSTAAELIYLKDPSPYLTAEVCLHHLFFHIGDYDRLGSRIQMNPSIKNASDNAGLMRALKENVIQVIATDHAPHTLEEKAQPYPASPSGLPAVENSLALMLDRFHAGSVTLPQIAHWMCDAPARVWSITGKGRIAEGYDADFVLVDCSQQRTILDQEQHTKNKWSPWHGESLTGWPVATFVAGRRVWDKMTGFCEEHRGTKPVFDHARGGYWNTTDGIGPCQ